MKKVLIGVFIGMILTLSGVVIAANINASNIHYKDDKMIDEALDDLYLIANNYDCVSGTFICTTCNTSSGQEVLDFKPSTFVTRWYDGNNGEVVHYYNKNISENYVYNWVKENNTYTANMSNSTVVNKYFSNSKLVLHDFSSIWVNHEIYYIACR